MWRKSVKLTSTHFADLIGTDAVVERRESMLTNASNKYIFLPCEHSGLDTRKLVNLDGLSIIELVKGKIYIPTHWIEETRVYGYTLQ